MTNVVFHSWLLCSASSAAMNTCLLSLPVGLDRSPPLGFLARAWMWLRLIWTGGRAETIFTNRAPRQRKNRAVVRRSRRRVPLSRRANPLAFVLARRFGRARFLRFLYDETLTGRVRWCFTAWNWKWPPRVSCTVNLNARRAKHGKWTPMFCGTPITLHPD